MKRWSMLLIIALAVLLMPASTAIVSAQGELSISKEADKDTASVGETVTYTYNIVNNTDNVTIDNITLKDDPLGIIDLGEQKSLNAGANITATATYTVAETDLPGPLVNTATVSGTDPDGNAVTDNATATVELAFSGSIKVVKSADKTSASAGDNITYTYTITNTGNVTLDDVTLEDDKLGELLSGVTLAPGESVTTTATYEVATGDFWRLRPITNIATVTATDPDGEPISAMSEKVSVGPHRVGMFKAMILWLSGVPGKGIATAPGLQKPFNPKSQAAEHAGKKDKPGTPEQLQIRERTENEGTEQQLQIQLEVENEAGSGQATQNDGEAGQGKGQLKKNQGEDNQTQGQQPPNDNGNNKPEKDKQKKNPKAGNKP